MLNAASTFAFEFALESCSSLDASEMLDNGDNDNFDIVVEDVDVDVVGGEGSCCV